LWSVVTLKRTKGINYIIKRKGFVNFIDKLNFLHIFFIWIFLILSVGLIYYIFQNDSSFLLYVPKDINVNEIKDAIYFSFVAATTTGFGDIIPFGFFKIVAIFEVVFGLLLLALVTSKLISIKQDMILNELYESSINERMSRIRSALLLFRQHLDRIVTRIEEKSITKREIDYIQFYISSFCDSLKEVFILITKKDGKDFAIDIDPVGIELIFNSVLSSFERLNEMIIVLNQNKINWKTDIVLNHMNKCISISENLFSESSLPIKVTGETIKGLNSQRKEVIRKIKNSIK